MKKINNIHRWIGGNKILYPEKVHTQYGEREKKMEEMKIGMERARKITATNVYAPCVYGCYID